MSISRVVKKRKKEMELGGRGGCKLPFLAVSKSTISEVSGESRKRTVSTE